MQLAVRPIRYNGSRKTLEGSPTQCTPHFARRLLTAGRGWGPRAPSCATVLSQRVSKP